MTDEVSEVRLQPVDSVRTRLSVVWFSGALVILLLVAVQTLNGRYGDHTQEVWTWLLPNLMPTLGTILAGIVATAMDPHRSRSVVRSDFYRLSLGISLFYLALVLLTILIAPTGAGVTAKGAVEEMHTANLWLGPVQGVVATVLGVLFASKQKRQSGKASSGAGADAD
jgi:hypothetical protein